MRNCPNGFADFAERRWGAVDSITATPLAGGLDSCAIYRVDAKTGSGCVRFVAKNLCGAGVRELDVYRMLRDSSEPGVAPRLLGMHRESRNQVFIFLEWIPATWHWPWTQLDASAAVMTQLSRVHSLPVNGLRRILSSQVVDRDMEASAAETAELYHRTAPRGGRPMHRAIDRIAANIQCIRRHLTASSGVAVLHGDVHSGNVIVRPAASGLNAVLLDWGRARLGSPLEDVASWLQSLSYWEPVVRSKHDTLLAQYLRESGFAINAEMRRLYWLAAGSNAMAGALRYHLAVSVDSARSRSLRRRSAMAVKDWMRIIRRADECWRRADNRIHQIA